MSIIPVTPSATTPSSSTPAAAASDGAMIANNFQTFLQLLTTQLKNQNPMDPLDTNQFTQQLVQFAQVEQQMKSNSQLEALLNLEKAAQATVALAYVGQTVVVDGSTTALDANGATWSMTLAKPSTTKVVITDSTGQTAYTGTFAMQTGTQNFTWDGKGNDGRTWPAGNYTMRATATDASGQNVAVSTEIQAVVDSVDVSKDPPILSINGRDYTADKIKRVVRPSRSLISAPLAAPSVTKRLAKTAQ
jgi:flagellar basal-body rod modification protein FlgD